MKGHLVNFHPIKSEIAFWEDDELKQAELKDEIHLHFGKEKRCIGYNDGNALYPCPGGESGAKQCRACAARDVSRVYTRLDCTGFESFYEKFRNQRFSVYLASFGHLVKCGVTRTPRLLERLREQGADYFSELARTEDADTAYSIESAVHSNFAVRNAVTGAQKMKLANSDAGPGRLEASLAEIGKSGMVSGFEGEMAVRKLDYNVPKSFSESDGIEGKIFGNKGNILFFEKDGAHYAVNMGRKLGSLFF